MPTPWEDPPGSGALATQNAATVLSGIASNAAARVPPTIAESQQWHRALYVGLPRPFDYYAGEVRDSDPDFPDLIGYEVQVGNLPGVASARVPSALAHFEQAAQGVVATLDAAIPAGQDAAVMAPRELHGVLTLCAFLHGEWVRIHPFANGNGRTARLWANWAALRYGLPPFVTVRPRPGNPYGAAALASMSGAHGVTLAVFDQMLRDYLSRLP